MSWVRVPPEAADFSLKKSSSGVVELLFILEGVSKFVYHIICVFHGSIFKKMYGTDISYKFYIVGYGQGCPAFCAS